MKRECLKLSRNFKKLNKDILTVTVLDDDAVKKISDEIVKRLVK